MSLIRGYLRQIVWKRKGLVFPPAAMAEGGIEKIIEIWPSMTIDIGVE